VYLDAPAEHVRAMLETTARPRRAISMAVVRSSTHVFGYYPLFLPLINVYCGMYT
jgi:hypothetical protein